MSSELAPYSIARTASEIISPALGPLYANSTRLVTNTRQGKRTDDMYAENSVRLLLSKELDKALRVEVRLGTRIGSKGELANIVLNTSCLEVLLRLSYPGNLGVRVNDRRDAIVVDVAVARFEVFNRGDPLLLCLVGEHRTKGHVTDTLDVLDRGAELVIDDDTTLVVFLDTNGFEVETLRVWTTTDRNQNNIGFELRWR